MAVKPFQARAKHTTPVTGDDIEYKGGHYVVRVKSGKVQIFHDGQYIDLVPSRLTLVSESPKKWLYDENKKIPSTSPQGGTDKFVVTVNINGRVEDFSLVASSEGTAKNKAVGIIAKQTGLTIQGVYMLLKRPPNSISAKRA